MGMFDDITCKYPLPIKEAQDLFFQTKDTPSQSLDKYEIREDGSLWSQQFEYTDTPDDSGFLERVSSGWRKEVLTGEIRFYTFMNGDYLNDDEMDAGWVEFSAYFTNGELISLNVLRHEPAGNKCQN